MEKSVSIASADVLHLYIYIYMEKVRT